MSDDPRTKPVEHGDHDDDRVVSERVQPAVGPAVGTELEDADTINEAGQVGAPEPEYDDSGVMRTTTYKLPASREQVPATQGVGVELRSVQATTVLLEKSGAEQVTAERVTMERSGAKSMDVKSAQLDRSGVVALGSEHAVLLRSSAVQVVAEEARLSRSAALFVQAEKATLEDSRVLLFAGTAEGDVTPLCTPQSAAIFGAVAGAVFALLTLLLSRGGRRGRRAAR